MVKGSQATFDGNLVRELRTTDLPVTLVS